MSEAEEEKMGMQLDNKISTGHLLTVVAMGIAGLAAYKDTQNASLKNTAEIQVLHAEIKNLEGRVRTSELSMSTVVTDMSYVKSGISRIEAKLDKNQEGINR